MNTETGNDASSIEAEVCQTVEQGNDVQEKVRQLTLRAISARSLDIDSVRQTAGAVLRGAQAAVQNELQHSSAQTDIARERLKQAVAGLDIALAQFAEAAQLTVEEAAGRAQKYSSDDLKRARSDLAKLESMFVETLQSSALAAKNTAGEILHDLAAHTRIHGSAIGAQLKDTLSVLTRHIGAAGHAQVGVGLHLAKNTSDLLRQIAAGVLTGLAERAHPGHSKNKGE
ncbi:MAG: hypothetical protein A3F73_13185 [Gallionellales bacterium RIFCSPLOWO2_12_FULL_59_22]|nr:MAG: hypothetical protein A3H99_00700 [Gallionellales bacterium RIFCSPLOWO2_02_FULL_59_110]OGT04768.1 MAG: hypothetical protein A2Z65_07320 [Gallionellales bacterium RIFCSPLOWO2_02_58_13]OGT11923.1 MAG: hypothetical protein A3F73_13185 [Gallionellales bacterium RIFCSPLOWO2_12_FULL_59_22]